MELLKSDKLKLPAVYYITNREEIKEIPIGVPFIFGDENTKKSVIRIMEYEILYQKAIQSGYPFNFKKILKDNGFLDLKDWYYSTPVYMELSTEPFLEEESLGFVEMTDIKEGTKFREFMKDSSAYVNIQELKDLNVFPLWLDDIEKAIETNIHNFAVFNSNMYNKKLEGMYGAIELTSPDRNLIIIDISGSIPKAVSSTCLALAKNLTESFYADLLITGSKSTLYLYENIHELNIDTIYHENGTDNDQIYFKKLITSEEKKYATVICFGDNHTFRQDWHNKYNKKTSKISLEDGKKMCKWKTNKLIAFHTSNREEDDERVPGYADCFTPKETQFIKNWVKYLN